MQVNLSRIKELRMQRGFTLGEMAKTIGLKSDTGYLLKEQGERQFSASQLGLVAARFRVSVGSLLLKRSEDR